MKVDIQDKDILYNIPYYRFVPAFSKALNPIASPSPPLYTDRLLFLLSKISAEVDEKALYVYELRQINFKETFL